MTKLSRYSILLIRLTIILILFMDAKILLGEKHSPSTSPLFDFEAGTVKSWRLLKNALQIPDGFLFLAGVVKYKGTPNANLRFGKDYVFVQSFLPHKSDGGIYKTRNFGRIYSLYEPATKDDDDVVLDDTSIYLSLPNDRVRLILGIGEHRNAKAVKQMFDFIRTQRGLRDFAPENSLPKLFEVTFKTKSSGYFLKGKTYQVWAAPVGIPDQQTGEIAKGWVFCDVNCGIPAIIKAEREEFIPLSANDGDKVGLFTVHGGNLVYRIEI